MPYVCFFKKKKVQTPPDFNFCTSLLAYQKVRAEFSCHTLACRRHTHTRMWMVLQISRKEAYVTESLSKYAMTEMNVEVKRMLIPNTLLTLSSVLVCEFIKIRSALRTYWFSRLSSFRVWSLESAHA